MADFEETLHLVVDFLRKYSYVELAQALELEAAQRPGQHTNRQLSRLEGLLRKGLLWERTDDLVFKTPYGDVNLEVPFSEAEESRTLTRSQPTLPILNLGNEKKEAKEMKRRALFSCPWDEGRGFSRHSREPHLNLSMPKIHEPEISGLAGDKYSKSYLKLSASVPVYSTRLFLDNYDMDDEPYLKTATPSNSLSFSSSLLKSTHPESDESEEHLQGEEDDDDFSKERSGGTDYIFEMEGVGSNPTTPQQLRKIVPSQTSSTTLGKVSTKASLPALVISSEQSSIDKVQEELQAKKEQERLEQERLEKEKQEEQERLLKEEQEKKRREVEAREREQKILALRKQRQSSPRTTDTDLDFSECNIVNNPGETLEYFNLRVIYQRKHTGFEETRDFPIRKGDIIAGRYEIYHFLGSAAFSRAVQCLDRKTNEMVCMKIIKNTKDFYDQCLDEIKLLKYIKANGDPDDFHILNMYDYFYFKEHLFIVCELLRDNLYEFYKYNRTSGSPLYFNFVRLQMVARQCLTAIEYIHGLNLIHCDLKPENLLIQSYSKCQIKVIDFGSSCFIGDELSTYVQSRSYRAPEVILGLPYGQPIDLWSLGCILAELFTGYVLFQNNSVATLLARIIGIIGPIKEGLLKKGSFAHKYFTSDYTLYEQSRTGTIEYLYPNKSSLATRLKTDDALFLDFLKQLLMIDPKERPTATEALQHPWLSHNYGELDPWED